MKLLESGHENGNYWYDYQADISVFEDTQEATCYYSWRGDWDKHDGANKSPLFDTMDEAIEWVTDHVRSHRND